MSNFQQLFGGNTIKASAQSYLSLALSSDVTLKWPIEQSVGGSDVLADTVNVIPGGTGYSVTLSDARQASTGLSALFINSGASDFTVKSFGGATIVSPAPGTAWVVVLTDNSSSSGQWTTFQLGATVAAAQASALAGIGLVVRSGKLDQQAPVKFFASGTHTFQYEDVANLILWTGGIGIFDFATGSAYGPGWFTYVYNSGSGTLTLAPTVNTIDGSATKVLDPGESCMVFCDGADFYTIGMSGGSGSSFDYTSISVAGGGNYTLSGTELNRVAYNLTGILTATRTIIVPASLQQYWISNQTTGAFNLYVKTAAQGAPGIQVIQGDRAILYCDGTNVVDADTGTVTFPITVSQGGTGGNTQSTGRSGLGAGAVGDAVFVAATADAGLTALGGTTVGKAVVTAVDAAAARTAMSAAGLGANTFTGTQLISNIFPAILMRETDGAADSKDWYWVIDSNGMSMRLRNDAGTSESYLWTVQRSGLTPGAWTFGVPEMKVSYGTPNISLNDTGAVVDNRLWKIRNISEGLYITAYTDDELNGQNAIVIDRTGYVIDAITLLATNIVPVASAMRWFGDAIEKKVIAGYHAGPEIRSKWNSSTTDRYLKIGIRDNLDVFDSYMTVSDSAITFDVWPTISGIKIDHGAGAYKTGTTSRASTISIASDPDLVVSCNPGTYMVEGQLIFDCASGGTQGFQFAIVHTGSGADLRYQLDGCVDGVATTTLGAVGQATATHNTIVQFNTISTSASGNAVHFRGAMSVVTSGTMDVRWSQVSSNVVATNLRPGSFLKVTRMI